MGNKNLIITIEREYGSGGRIVGRKLAEELGLDKKGGCILSYNGGKIVDCRTGETLVEKTLDWYFPLDVGQPL